MKNLGWSGGGVIDYQIKRIPVNKGLYSLNDQYFVEDVIQIEENEIFVDGGAYVGDTIQSFINKAKRKKVNSYKIIAFEPDENNYSVLKNFFWE